MEYRHSPKSEPSLFSPIHSRSIRRRRQHAAGPNGTLAAGTGGGTTGDTLSVNNEGIVVAAGDSISFECRPLEIEAVKNNRNKYQ